MAVPRFKKLCQCCGSGMSPRVTGSWYCDRCKIIESYSGTIGEQMKEKKSQRFGRLVQSFGDFGELRKQHKKPNLEVFYIPVKMPAKHPIGGGSTVREVEVLRSVNNCTSEQITEFIRTVGKNLEAGNLSQDKGETVLNYLYAEINRRVNGESKHELGSQNSEG